MELRGRVSRPGGLRDNGSVHPWRRHRETVLSAEHGSAGLQAHLLNEPDHLRSKRLAGNDPRPPWLAGQPPHGDVEPFDLERRLGGMLADGDLDRQLLAAPQHRERCLVAGPGALDQRRELHRRAEDLIVVLGEDVMGLEPRLRRRAVGGNDIDRQADVLREGCLRPHLLAERRGDDTDEGDLLGLGPGGVVRVDDEPLAITDDADRDRLRLGRYPGHIDRIVSEDDDPRRLGTGIARGLGRRPDGDGERLSLHDRGRGVVGKGDWSNARRDGREEEQVRPFHGTRFHSTRLHGKRLRRTTGIGKSELEKR